MQHHRAFAFRLALIFAVLGFGGANEAARAQEPPKRAAEPPQYPPMRVLYLKNATASGVQKTLSDLYADAEKKAELRIVADDRTNALFIAADDALFKQLEELLKVLDADQTPKKPQTFEAADEVKIFTLENADAAEAAGAVRALLGEAVQISSDQRTNSVIATGPKSDLETASAILLRLDENQSKPADMLKVYPIKNVSVSQAVNTLNNLGFPARVAVDEEQHRLLVRGNEKDYKLLAELLTTIDVAKPGTKLEQMQLRIVWLVHQNLVGKEAREPAKNLEKVVKVLEEKLGATNLKMAAQLLVTVDPGQVFSVQGSTEFLEGTTVQIEAQGAIIGQTGANPSIEVSIHATKQGVSGEGFSSAGQALTSLTTKVTAPPGHSIILGTTPIQSADSVFVLQVLPNEEAPAPKNRTEDGK